MIVEHVDRRVLGAIRIVDAITGQRVTDALDVRVPGATVARNLGGDVVVRTVAAAVSAELRAHADAFAAPPATPPVGDVDLDVTVSDPRERYLPRRATLSLPRDADPTSSSDPDSLFQPLVVRLFRSPAGAVAGGWAVVRAHVPGEEGAGALIRAVRRSDDVLLGSGMTDRRGEALIAVAGIPVTTFDPGGGPAAPVGPPTGPVLITSVAARLELIVDPGAEWPPDPDDLEDRADALRVRTVDVDLRAGSTLTLTI